MLSLLVDEGCVDLEDSSDRPSVGEAGKHGGEQGVALPHKVGGVRFEVLGNGARRHALRAFAVGAVDGKRVGPRGHARQVGWRVLAQAHGVDLDLVPTPHEFARDVLDVDGGPLGAVDGDAGVSAHVCDSHQRSSSPSRLARRAAWTWES